MTCLTPAYTKRNSRTGSNQFLVEKVPCGTCPKCIKTKVRQWVFRLEQERQSSLSSAFITLTYSDDHVPRINHQLTLEKEDLQKFMKRLRKFVSKNFPGRPTIKYYMVGEYGDLTHRPHYHAIIFNLPRLALVKPDIIQTIWNKGHIDIQACNEFAIRYVTGYVLKKQGKVKFKHLSRYYDPNTKKHRFQVSLAGTKPGDNRNPEFSLMSKGLGDCWLTAERKKYYRDRFEPFIIQPGGDKIVMPRYYRDRIFSENERISLKYKILRELEKMEKPSEKTRIDMTNKAFSQARRNSRLKRKTL